MRNKFIEEKRKADSRVEWGIKNKIQWLNPTISPAPKDVESGEIESLKKGMEYFQPYSDKLVLQTKYMGSYCCMYLNKDHTKSYFASRNGYVINHVQGLHKASEEIHNKLFNNDEEWILVESELMPWRTLGSGLIDEEYGNYGFLHQTHLSFIKNSSILDKVKKLRENKPWERDDLKEHEVKQYNSLRDLNLYDYQESLDLYMKQFETFGKEDDVHFKPFNILKIILKSGEELFPKFQDYSLNDDDSVVIDADDYKTAYEFLNKHKNLNHEGIMIKPLTQQLINIAPCLKVRTNSYLQLIYGVNFDRYYEYYLNKRNIQSKLRQSIEDYEIAIQMLHTKYTTITNNNTYYKLLYYKAIDGEHFTKTLDTRL